MNGYIGKLLVVDLTGGKIAEEPLKADYARDYLGGSGVAARYLYDLIGPNTDPLGPDNPLIFMAGPLTGTAAPSCGRHVVVARSPLTSLWGEANSGGDFGAQLRLAGCDGIIFEGCSPKPVYLSVINGKAELHDATRLWGLDSYEVQERIKAERGLDKKASIACIGPAGEHLVKFAAVMNDEGRAAGRTGLGAVMGSKNLKAIVARGDHPIALVDETRFQDALRCALTQLKDDIAVEMYRQTGTAGGVDYLAMVGDMPNRYWTQGSFDTATNLGGAVMAETILRKNDHCYLCPIACWRVTATTQEPYRQDPIDGPEYETVAALGSLLLIDNLEAVTYAGHLCNAYGLDTFSAGSTIAFAYYLFDQGVITEKDTGGLALKWGQIDPAIELIKQIAFRAGFGAILAEGSRAVARRFGVDEDLTVQVNGLDVAMHDPRALAGMALVYATSPRGACHNQGDAYWVECGRAKPELGIESVDRFASEGKTLMVARIQDWRSTYNALVMCIFCDPDSSTLAEMVSAVTGRSLTAHDLMRIGERIWNLKRGLNNRLGLTRANDKLPKLLRQSLSDGGTEGHVPPVDAMLTEYYQVRGWDPTTGKPTREKLVELGLDFVARDLWG
jgi:aldehyde:ferredoxin oxidoreductase